LSESAALFAVFLFLALAGLGGIFLYGWKRRKEAPPKVAPLPPDDDDDWK
jgi:LPXTG-motif cell wall-anchored protein